MGVGMLSTFRKLMLNLIYNKSIEDNSIQKYIALSNSTIRNIVHEKMESARHFFFLFLYNTSVFNFFNKKKATI